MTLNEYIETIKKGIDVKLDRKDIAKIVLAHKSGRTTIGVIETIRVLGKSALGITWEVSPTGMRRRTGTFGAGETYTVAIDE